MKNWKLIIILIFLVILVAAGTKIIRNPGEGHAGHEEPGHIHESGETAVQKDQHGEPVDDAHDDEGAAVHDHGDEGDPGHDHGDETGEGEEGGHDEVRYVHLSDDMAEKFEIEVGKAGPVELEIETTVQGEIVINMDRMAHIVPRVAGIAHDVRKTLGDDVKKGEVMAVLESRELADAKASCLASMERHELASAVFDREERLWKEKISSEQEYLDARQKLAEARIEMRSARQKLMAIGLSRQQVEDLPGEPSERFTLYQIRAPFDGTVIEKHVTTGETISGEAEIFVIADLDSVWVDLQVHQAEAAMVAEGQEVTVSSHVGRREARGKIVYIGPVIDDRTRTTLARVVIDNRTGGFRPGTFISARIIAGRFRTAIAVEKEAIQEIDDQTCVFVKDSHGFQLRPVITGRSDAGHVEIIAGLNPGEPVVVRNSFRLKAELEKSDVGGHAGHSH